MSYHKYIKIDEPEIMSFPSPSASAGTTSCCKPCNTVLSHVMLGFGEALNLHANVTFCPTTASISPGSEKSSGMEAEKKLENQISKKCEVMHENEHTI